jgi:hypothetical protein
MKYSPERIAAMAAGKREWERKRFEQEHGLPDNWRCPACKKYKPIREFGLRAHVTVIGVTRWYPRSKCKQCEREKTAERKKRKIAGDPEGYRETRRQASERNNKRRRSEVKNAKDAELPTQPLLDWWDGLVPDDRLTYSQIEAVRVAIRDARKRPGVAIGVVDRIGVRIKDAGLLARLYPD